MARASFVRLGILLLALFFMGLLILSSGPVSNTVQAQIPPPSFSKAFLPDTIGPGGTTQLRFNIDNTGTCPFSCSQTLTMPLQSWSCALDLGWPWVLTLMLLLLQLVAC